MPLEPQQWRLCDAASGNSKLDQSDDSFRLLICCNVHPIDEPCFPAINLLPRPESAAGSARNETLKRGADERYNPGWRLRDAALSGNNCSVEATPPCFRQADDLLSIGRPDVCRYSRYSNYYHATGPTVIRAIARRRQ